MKRLTCEMCGSTDLMKQDGVFVCQSCGCKYSVEEAKKMMVEGTVDVSGSKVKIDDSEELKKLYQVARRAGNSDNSENAAKYYDMILMKDPESWEANFYAVYYKAMSCKFAEIPSALGDVTKCIPGTFNLIKKYVEEPEQRIKAFNEVLARTTILAKSMLISYGNYYESIPESIRSNYLNEYKSVLHAFKEATSKPISLIIYLYSNDEEFMLNYGYDAIKEYLKELGDEWEYAEVARKVLAKYDDIFARKREEERERKAREAKERFDSYWEAHAEEKASLESEKNDLSSQICALNTLYNDQVATLNKELAAIPGKTEIDNIEARIQKLIDEKYALGLFKGKEKKALQEQIDQAYAEKKSIQDPMDAAKKEIEAKIESVKAEIQRKITPLQDRVNTISNELTKAR